VTLAGTISDAQGKPMKLSATVPLAPMQQAARAVGRYIATAKLQALGGAGIQQVETWDDADEAKAQALRAAMLGDGEVRGLGDAAHALAAATLAALDQPDAYDKITASLNAALDHNFQNDPVWGVPEPDRLYLRYSA
jgi:hypothetical protein